MKPVKRTRSDTTQAAIVQAIRKAGWDVYIIGWPCDLLCWKAGRGFKTLEVKSKRKKDGTVVLKAHQEEQAEFCYRTSTPYVTSPEEALEQLSK